MGFYFDIQLSEEQTKNYIFEHVSLEHIIRVLLDNHPMGRLMLTHEAIVESMKCYVDQSEFVVQSLSNGVESRNVGMTLVGNWEEDGFAAEAVVLDLSHFGAGTDFGARSQKKILKLIETLEKDDRRLDQPSGSDEDFPSSLSSSEQSSELLESSGNENDVRSASPSLKPQSPIHLSIKNNESVAPPKSLFNALKWPVVAGLASMGLSALLQASRLAILGLSTAATLTFGFASAALFYVAQRVRDEVKQLAFKHVFRKNDAHLDMQTCVNLPEQQWLAVREGIEGHRSILTQFKSCFIKNNWSHAAHYYSGAQLSEIQPELDCADVDAIRKLKI